MTVQIIFIALFDITLLLQCFNMENLPKEIAEAIKNGAADNQLIKMAQDLLENGDQENAAKVLDFCF
ncbi:hypothetical protein JCM15579A_03580 [Marinifilum fragile]